MGHHNFSSKIERRQACILCLLTVLLLLLGLQQRLSAKETDKPAAGLIILKSDALTVMIDRVTGLPYAYRYRGAVIWGADSLKAIPVVVCRLQPREYVTVCVKPTRLSATANTADIVYKAIFKNELAATFHLKYTLHGASLIITQDEVTEENGFELIESALPDIATIREEDDNDGWLAHPMDGGELVRLKDARSNHVPGNTFFGDIGYVLPAAIIGTRKAECVMEVAAYMDDTEIAITGKNGKRHAKIGTVQVYRVHGGRAYNMNDGGPGVKGNDSTPNLIVGQQSRCRLDFADDIDNSGKVDWVDGAKLLAARMPVSPTGYFDDKLIYLVAGKYKPEKKPRTTFAQSEKLIKDISLLTDDAPQLALISGWVYDGQDTGFPSEDVVNESLGGYEGLKHLIDQGRKYNANVSLNVNYDDAYQSSHAFDTAFIARRPDGKIWRSLDWAGEDSYIVGMAKYMSKWGELRMDYTVQRYNIRDALLIDAMSWHSIRNDWDPAHPASGYKNLVDGKFKIIEGFNKRGLAVISEHLRYPFIGRLAVSADGFGGGSSVFGGAAIPMLAAIYRKSAIWGAGNFSRNDPARNLFWNCRSIQWYSNMTDRNEIADYYYLTVLPFAKVHNLAIESYQQNGFRTEIGLANHSKISNDWMGQSYAITAAGVEIAGNNSTYCPIDPNRIAFFARDTKELKAALPQGWDTSAIVARALYIDHREPVKVEIENNKIVVKVIAQVPVIVYRNADQANRYQEKSLRNMEK
jgi:hypothetical protein